jgi:hypothetical protein
LQLAALRMKSISLAFSVLLAPMLLGAQAARGPQIDLTPARQLSLMVGTTSDTWSGAWGLTIGPTFRVRVSDGFAVGPIAEAEFTGGAKNLLLLAGAFITPNRRITVFAAPGLSIMSKGSSSVQERDVAFRMGVQYTLHTARHLRLLPTIGLEYGDRRTNLISGLSIGLPF